MSAKFIAEDFDYNRIPGLEAFLERVEKEVTDFAKESGADEAEIRRFVVGRVGYRDLNQVLAEFKYEDSAPRSRAISSWNAFVSHCAEEDEDEFSFTPEYMASLKERYNTIDEELKEKVESKKKMMEHHKKIGNKRPNNPTRVELFQSCVKSFQKNANAMYTNFQQHMIVCGVNGVMLHEDDFPAFIITNSGNSYKTTLKCEKSY